MTWLKSTSALLEAALYWFETHHALHSRECRGDECYLTFWLRCFISHFHGCAALGLIGVWRPKEWYDFVRRNFVQTLTLLSICYTPGRVTISIWGIWVYFIYEELYSGLTSEFLLSLTISSDSICMTLHLFGYLFYSFLFLINLVDHFGVVVGYV